jgi:hypothetical protein
MAVSTKDISIALVCAIIAGGAGFFIGSQNKKVKEPLSDLAELPRENAPSALEHDEWEKKTLEELSSSLSTIMLPDEEYSKLGDAIYQTALNLLMAQAQAADLEVSVAAEEELKDSINKKYSRQYFADMNALSMKELSKSDLVAILSFYNTEAGKKFLTLSPKIIESTMTSVQTDLSQWLPTTVDNVLNKLKTGKKEDTKEKEQDNNKPHSSQIFKDKDELKS